MERECKSHLLDHFKEDVTIWLQLVDVNKMMKVSNESYEKYS